MLGSFGQSLEIFLQLPRLKSQLRRKGEVLKFEILRRFVEKQGFSVGLLFLPDLGSLPSSGTLVVSAANLPGGLSFPSTRPQWVIPLYRIQRLEGEEELPTAYPSWQSNVINLPHGSELEGSLPLLDTLDMARNAIYLLRCHPAPAQPAAASVRTHRQSCAVCD